VPQYLGMWWIHGFARLLGLLLLIKERPTGMKFLGLFKRKQVTA
jgi:lipopolysaccharide export system permease protein